MKRKRKEQLKSSFKLLHYILQTHKHTHTEAHTPKSTTLHFIGLFRVLKRDRCTNTKPHLRPFSFVLWGLKTVLETLPFTSGIYSKIPPYVTVAYIIVWENVPVPTAANNCLCILFSFDHNTSNRVEWSLSVCSPGVWWHFSTAWYDSAWLDWFLAPGPFLWDSQLIANLCWRATSTI